MPKVEANRSSGRGDFVVGVATAHSLRQLPVGIVHWGGETGPYHMDLYKGTFVLRRYYAREQQILSEAAVEAAFAGRPIEVFKHGEHCKTVQPPKLSRQVVLSAVGIPKERDIDMAKKKILKVKVKKAKTSGSGGQKKGIGTRGADTAVAFMLNLFQTNRTKRLNDDQLAKKLNSAFPKLVKKDANYIRFVRTQWNNNGTLTPRVERYLDGKPAPTRVAGIKKKAPKLPKKSKKLRVKKAAVAAAAVSEGQASD